MNLSREARADDLDVASVLAPRVSDEIAALGAAPPLPDERQPDGWRGSVATPTPADRATSRIGTEYGPPHVVQVVEGGEPHAGPGLIRLGVRASGLSTGEGRLRSGALRERVPAPLPFRTGSTRRASWARSVWTFREYASATRYSE